MRELIMNSRSYILSKNIGGPERAVLPYKYILARIRCSYEHTCTVYRTYNLRHNH